MDENDKHSLNYHLLKNNIHVKQQKGFRQTVINLLINENKGLNQGKCLFAQSKWGISRDLQDKVLFCKI